MSERGSEALQARRGSSLEREVERARATNCLTRIDEPDRLLERDVLSGSRDDLDDVVAGHERPGREREARIPGHGALEIDGPEGQAVDRDAHRVRHVGDALQRDLQPRAGGAEVQTVEGEGPLPWLDEDRGPEELLRIAVQRRAEPGQPLTDLGGGEEGGDARVADGRGRGRDVLSGASPLVSQYTALPEYRVSIPYP